MDKFWNRKERKRESVRIGKDQWTNSGIGGKRKRKSVKIGKGSVDKFWNMKDRKRESVRIGKDQ